MQINIPDSTGMLIIGLILGIIIGVGFFIVKRLFKKKVSLDNIKEINLNIETKISESTNDLKSLSEKLKSLESENTKLKNIVTAIENAKR